ncbi:MAG: glycosyltransferase family 8 protein [Acetobacteraceae bacterium]|nr:glycosyltransferase family 8 protein [Acetobacteraceae bacterium]
MTEPISILFAFNKAYAQHAAACLASLIRHSSSPLEVVIASTEDPERFAPRFRSSFGGETRVSLRFERLGVPSDTSFPTPYTLTTDAYLRLWADVLFPDRARVLYLDPDTVAVGSIEPLWRTDLEGNTVGAVPIPNSVRPAQHGMPPGSLFFNSGVLLIDLEAWRAEEYCRRCLDFIQKYPERAIDADQDILNLVLAGDWLPLDYKWNVINPFFRPSYDMGMTEAERRAVCDDAVIIHYNGGAKPWVYLDNHPRQQDYFDNLARTDWRDYRPADRTPLNMCRKALLPFVPPQLRSAIKSAVDRLSSV